MNSAPSEGALFFLAYAAMIGDVVFVVAQAVSVAAICVIVIFARTAREFLSPERAGRKSGVNLQTCGR
jgi:lipid-A-disaccharide synthase-like uncharacterized protein